MLTQADITQNDFCSRCRLLCVIALASVCCHSAAATEMEPQTPQGDLHGPLGFLQHSLVLSAEDGRLIAAAERQLQLGDKGRAYTALQVVFARQHDTFTPLLHGRASASAYRSALQILQQANFSVRRDWAAEMEPLAATALQQASSDLTKVNEVARHFPYTRSGQKAYIIGAVLAKTRGQAQLANAILAELESQYADTAVSFNARELLTGLRAHLRHQATDAFPAKIAGGPVIESPQQLTLPWPEPFWKWQESVWEFPQGASALAALTQPDRRATLAMNSWRPALTRDSIILRTPFRIIAFDRSTGRIRWSMLTDTVGKPIGVAGSIPGANAGIATSAEELLRMDNLGSIAATDRFVFFIDRFRKLKAEDGGRFQRPHEFQMPLTDQERNGGTRLVAVHLQPVPQVAWTAGDAETFDYQISTPPNVEVAPQTQSPTDSFDRSNGETPPLFAGQNFLGVPLVHDQMLFLLSADTETVWLNCLTAATGRLLWQVPVSYQNQQPLPGRGRLIVQPEEQLGASLCGVADDTVVCALKAGVAVGVSLTDGRFRWATNVRGEDLALQLGGQGAFRIQQPAIQRKSFPPFLHMGRMYWSAHQSSEVSCIDTNNGKIVWQISRSAGAGGVMEGSVDHYAVAVIDDQLVLIGDRHIRAVSTKDGSQLWATYLPPQSGQATCNDKFCLVPLQNGTVASVNLPGGTMNPVSQDVLTGQSDETIGTLLADADFVYSTTPLSVAAFPTVAHSAGREIDDASAPQSVRFRDAQVAILSANVSQAVTILRQEIDTPAAAADVPRAQKLLAEVLLRAMAVETFQQRAADAGPPEYFALQSLETLQRLPLTAEQDLRLSILAGDNHEPRGQTAAPQLLDLLPDWRARSDVSAWANLSSFAASKIEKFRPQPVSLLAAAEHAILFPEHVGTVDEQLAFADDLVRQHFATAAELFLLAARRNVTDPDRSRLDSRLKAVRKPFMQVHSDVAALQIDLGKLRVEAKPYFYAGNRIAELLNDRVVHVDTPDWYANHLLFSNRLLSVADMQTGVVSADVRLPASPENTLLLLSSFESPGMLPLVGRDYVGMVSLVASQKPQLMWWKRFQREEFDLTPVQLGPFGPEFLIIATENRLCCLHPLTGNVLWTRDIAISSKSRNLFNNSIQFAGDDQVVAVFGEQMRSCEVFRTKDGQRLGIVPLKIPEKSVPIISGRRVLFPHEQQLQLIDLLDGKNLLEDVAVPKILSSSNAPLISDNRVVLMSEDREVVVLNVATGKIELKCPISAELEAQKQQIAGMSAFERNGRLYVLVKNWGNHYSQRSASSKMGEVRLDHGMLFCIDQKTGQRLWNHTTLPAIVPEIQGDPIDVLVKWAWTDPGLSGFQGQGFEPRDRNTAVRERSLTVSVIDAKTGDLKFAADHLSPGEPVRCVHDAKAATITLESDTAEIKVHYNSTAE